MRHLNGIQNLNLDQINMILDRAQYYADQRDDWTSIEKPLQGKTMMTLFFEDSTRTRLSFDRAARHLGAEIVNIDLKTSSVNKGENLLDTVKTMETIVQPDIIVMRHSEYGAPEYIANRINGHMINAGDSWREHPTQALLDALTIRQVKGTLQGLKIAICGDIAHSRVASSNMLLWEKIGANVHAVAPPTLMPQKFAVSNVTPFHDMDAGIAGCDIIMMLRLQKERMQTALIHDEHQYFKQYGMTLDRLQAHAPNAYVMHPGPINRGVEIDEDMADDPHKSLILKQVRNGVYTRMAIMDLLIRKAL
jgi:aspartate carbamoyltransferase catalytic subunit